MRPAHCAAAMPSRPAQAGEKFQALPGPILADTVSMTPRFPVFYALLPVFAAFRLCSAIPAAADQFAYHYEEGQKYRVLSIVEEDVYINRHFSHRARILNRCAVEVGGRGAGGNIHRAVFQTSEQALEGKSFRWADEYESVFERDALGRMSIGDRYFMPVVRNVPVFPGRELKTGENWNAEGHEMHDFRTSLGIEKPYRIPFNARYVFLGEREWKGARYPAFSVSYRIDYDGPPVPGARVWPRRIQGASDQTVYWDAARKREAGYHENFRIVMELSDGSTWEFRGSAESEVLEAEELQKEDTARDIAGALEELGITDASVRVTDEGVTISLENIQFPAESAALLDSEKTKLDKIAEILRGYPGRDILVSGHTALSGTAAGRQKLSLERAAAVSDYFIGRGVRDSSQIVVRGHGAGRPLAPNNTEESMKKNRRVEITILEN
jgi:outer membrane protein OmpA-like peptidoglycan-associated protein